NQKIPNAQPWAPQWLRSLIGEDYFRTMVVLDLSVAIHQTKNPQAIDFTRRALSAIDGLPSLRVLEMGDNPELDDAGVEHLSHLSQLVDLYLYRTGITGTGLHYLSGCHKLEFLHLDRTSLTDEGLAAIGKLKQLRMVNLSNTRITDASLLKLSEAKSLK